MKNSEIIKEIRPCPNLSQSEFISTNEVVTLYHGSKSGIRGAIAPMSRQRCDFGKGFYMGTDRTQPLTLTIVPHKFSTYTSMVVSGIL